MAHPLVEIREPGRPPWQLVVRDAVDVGRACQGVNLLDPEVSRRHLTLRNKRGQVTVRDVGSTNGTTVNGLPITDETVLAPGDVVGLGQVTIVVLPGEGSRG
ncbi:MAG TPA: FHA domain-containing protein [Mycobacteriales bacterium]|nr:FHA domain-containing protein [Mycobacteriales bacterium]